MVNEILSEIEDMGEEEFGEFSRYFTDVYSIFIQGGYEDADAVDENIEKLLEAGGEPRVLMRLDTIRTGVQSPEECATEIREYRNNSEYTEAIDETMKELLLPYFDSNKELEYRPE